MTASFHSDKEVDGIRGWFWTDSDTGAWDGPKSDWENQHKRNIIHWASTFDLVLQAGGNQGMYPKLLSRLFTKVITIEPDHDNFNVLVGNCRDTPNVFKFQAALGSAPGYVAINRPAMHNVGMHNVYTSSDPLVNVIPVITGDSLDLSGVGLIMFDLEGYEYEALLGLKKTLQENYPVLFLEHPRDEAIQFLFELGYRKVADSAMDQIFVKTGHGS